MEWSHTSDTKLGPMTSRPLTLDRFDDMATVFGERGVARGCFCMHWRRPDGGFGDNRSNQARYADVVESASIPPGLIGYVASRPLGWVQVGPREDFPTLARSRMLKMSDEAHPWSVNCFVVAVGHRKKGIARGLLAAAVDFARHHGAEAMEAYPVDGVRSTLADYFTGVLPMFSELGFVEVERRKPDRPIVRLSL